MTEKYIDECLDKFELNESFEDDEMDMLLSGIQSTSKNVPQIIEYGNSHTISSSNYIEFLIQVYSVNDWFKKLNGDKRILFKVNPTQFEYDYDKYSELYEKQQTVFIYENKIQAITWNADNLSIHISGKNSTDIYKQLMNHIRENNVLKNKLIFISSNNRGLTYTMKKPKNVLLKDVVLSDKIREDIYDNTIYHLDEIDGNNGLIFYGEPGTGKSLTCSAIINELILKGYSACYITQYVDFPQLETFLNKMLTPCGIFFEDIDSMGSDRRNNSNDTLSPLLQLLNGLSEKDGKHIFIATTNYIDNLDEALANRPVRFNRKIKFDYQKPDEINILIDTYFIEEKISDDLKELCHGVHWTGSHIQELKRTCDMHVKKYKKTYNEVFENCFSIVKENFSTGGRKLGF